MADDQVALGVLRLLDATGEQDLFDVAVVGFDDVREAGFFRPPPTTTRRALRLLLKLVGPQDMPIAASVRPPLPALVPIEPVVQRGRSSA